MIISWVCFFLYRTLFVPIANAFAKVIFPFSSGKTKEFLSDRFETPLPTVEAPCIWIHASSGEIEYAKPVIRTLKARWPQKPIVVSFFSPSAKKLIQNFPGIDAAFALPLENPKVIQRLIEHFRPECLLFARTDVWPELSYQLRRKKIPAYLFSATMAADSSRKGFFGSPLTRFSLEQLNEIHCVSQGDADEFQSFRLHTPIVMSGDTRYDQVLYRLKHPAPVKSELRPQKNEKIFVCGSTWPQDEKVLIPAFLKLKEKNYRIIIAPHEVSKSHLEDICRRLHSHGLTYSLYSKAETWTTDVLVVDQIGCLQEVYTWGSLGFVGGSFKDKVHSVMEPLAAGLPVLVGPFHDNNREALQFQHFHEQGAAAVSVVENSDDMTHLIEQIEPRLPLLKEKIRQKVLEKSGASFRLIEKVAPH